MKASLERLAIAAVVIACLIALGLVWLLPENNRIVGLVYKGF
jgi:hypothetical protein